MFDFCYTTQKCGRITTKYRSVIILCIQKKNRHLYNISLIRFQQDYRGNTNSDMLLDMNLVPVYEDLKYTGKGIRVAIIDDGIEYTHDDLKDNYVGILRHY